MKRLLPALLVFAPVAATAPAMAQQRVDASAPQALTVTLYRAPDRGMERLDLDDLNGFAMISETRIVDLPAGPATIRFEGVAEGMVAVSAIVTGLPGGTIEKNRNAQILSPAALVDGTLGNRVTLTRTNPATGAQVSQNAIVRTRADGGLVLQTSEGYEAVRCSGLPEKLQFDSVPRGLSAQPVFSIDTNSAQAGRHSITLSYLAAGFDWQANYIATLRDKDANAGNAGERRLRLLAWLTLGNDNGQSFPNATLLAVAGKLNIESDFADLADPPTGEPLRLTCFAAPAPPLAFAMPAPMEEYASGDIIVTAKRRSESVMDIPVVVAMKAGEEGLGDLKLYRVPEPVTVAAKSLKQVAFLDRPDVTGTIIHRARCAQGDDADNPNPARILLRTRNDTAHGLGIALPAGQVATFEPASVGDLLLGETAIPDHASGQEVEIELTETSAATLTCLGPVRKTKGDDSDDIDLEDGRWHRMQALATNANGHSITLEVQLADTAQWQVRGASGRTTIRHGAHIQTLTLPAGASRTIEWKLRFTDP